MKIAHKVDRRLFPRFPAVNLQAEVGDRLYPVEDISLGGVCLLAADLAVGTRCRVSFLATPDAPEPLQANTPVRTQALVVRRRGDRVGLRFERATMPLMKLILHQAAQLLGVEPYVVK